MTDLVRGYRKYPLTVVCHDITSLIKNCLLNLHNNTLT